jgi:LPS-assembly protein
MVIPKTYNSLHRSWVGLIVGILTALSLHAQTSVVTDATIPGEEVDVVLEGASNLTYDTATGEGVADKDVVISYGKVKLFADKVRYNVKTKQAHAEGNVRLRKGYKEWKAHVLDYNFQTGAMQADNSRIQFENGLFFEGTKIESSNRSRYIVKDGYFTTSDYDKPGYRLKAGKILLYPDNRIVFHHVVLYVGSVPVFYFPYFVLTLDDVKDLGLNSGTSVQLGTKGNWGFFVLNSYTHQLTENLRPTYHFDYREQRGLAGGVDLKYQAGQRTDHKDDVYPRVSGKIRTYYADDDKMRENNSVEVVRSTDISNQTISPERYQFGVSQRAEMSEEVYSKLKVNKLSDANFLEDFREKEFQRDPQPDNFLEVTKWSPNSTLSLLGRAQVNDFYTTTERLPELRFDMKRQPVFDTPLFYESENSVSYLAKEFAQISPLQNDYQSARVDTMQQFLYPKRYFGWLNFTPRAGGRATFYDQTPVAPDEPSVIRATFHTGFETGFKSSRTWKGVQNKKWEIDGLRHVVEPSLNYGFVARPNRQPHELYQFDAERSSFGLHKELVPINFPQYTAVDSVDRRNLFRPMLRQRLQTKRDGAVWNLAELAIYQDILVEKDHDETPFSDLFAEFSTRPVRWLALDWRGRYDYEGERIRESSTSASIFRGKTWKLDLGHSYFASVGNQMFVRYAWALNEDWTFRSEHRFEPTTGTLFEQAYSIDRDLHSWIASLSISELRPANHDTDLRIWLAFTLKAFPEITFDSRQFGPGGE